MGQMHDNTVIISPCCRIFVAKQSIGGLVLLDFGETTDGRIEAVVGIIIITLADFTQQNRAGAFFYREVVVQELLHMDALTGC